MRRVSYRWFLLWVVSLVLATQALTTCGGSSTLERAQATGTLRVGYANEVPYSYWDAAAAELTGEAPTIARAVLAELGISHLEGVLVQFQDLVSGLRAGQFEAIAAGLDLQPELCHQVAFSNPTARVGTALLVAAGNPQALHSYEDLRDRPATLGVVAGTTEQDYAETLDLPRGRLAVLPDVPSAVAAVRSGRIDAYGGLALTVQAWVDQEGRGELERAAPFTPPRWQGRPLEHYQAFAFRQQDQDLVQAFNRHLQAFIGTPAHQRQVRPFGFTAQELPGEVTAEALCQGTVPGAQGLK